MQWGDAWSPSGPEGTGMKIENRGWKLPEPTRVDGCTLRDELAHEVLPPALGPVYKA